MSDDRNPPAFPLVTAEYTLHGQQYRDWNAGMTLRDYFAGQALIGSYIGGTGATVMEIATQDVAVAHKARAIHAYEVADAMLAQREKGGAA